MSRRFEINVVVAVDAVDEDHAHKIVRAAMGDLEKSWNWNWTRYNLQTSVLDDADEVFPEDD